jgi:hypothetical protein
MFSLLSLSGPLAFSRRLAALIGIVSAINNSIYVIRPPIGYWLQLDGAIVRFAHKLSPVLALVAAAKLRFGLVAFASLSRLLQSSEPFSRLIDPALVTGSDLSCQMSSVNRHREITSVMHQIACLLGKLPPVGRMAIWRETLKE